MAKKPTAKTSTGDQIQLSAAEAEALTDLVSYALEADVARPPYRGALASALKKVGLLAKDGKPAVLAAAPAERLPVRAQ